MSAYPNFRAASRRTLLGWTLRGAATLALASLALPLPFSPALAGAMPPAAQLNEQDLQDVHRIEAYLTGIKSLKARFQQFSQNGGLIYGNIYLRRPGRLRIEYDPPVPVLIVADGTWASFYDTELDQLNQAPLGSTPAWFLLRDPVSLTDGVTITSLRRAPGAMQIEMYQTRDPDAGLVRLIMTDDPIELRQWYIVDGSGKEVHVGLDKVEIGLPLSNNLFVTPTPRRSMGRDTHK
jgi:outer membrane lipoprotein-sorting protein